MESYIFMSMEKAFEKILDSIVVPMNHRLSGVRVEKNENLKGTYDVTYLINDRIDFDDGQKIEIETDNMFRLLGLKGKDSFIISYKRAKNYVD